MLPSPEDKSPSESSFDVLMALARDGNVEGVNALLERYRGYLLLIANNEMPLDIQGKIAPSDVVQDTLLGAWQEIGRFRGSEEVEFLGWLRRILRNRITDQSRKFICSGKRQLDREVELGFLKTEELAPEAMPPLETPSTQAMQAEEIQLLEKALSRLSESQRQLIQLRNYERLSFKEIAERLNCSPDAARKAWARAIDSLRLQDERP